LRKFLTKRGDLISKVGGIFLILIGIAQMLGIWTDLMASLRSLISDFAPVI
jgi:cytochrome c-type biogenesis protein